MKKVRTLFENAQKKFFLVQAIVISMFANVAFCDDIFANINTKMTGYVSSISTLALTCVAFFGVCSVLLYISTSNERTAEKAKAWAIRCVVAIAGIMLFKTATGGTLNSTITELINLNTGNAG